MAPERVRGLEGAKVARREGFPEVILEDIISCRYATLWNQKLAEDDSSSSTTSYWQWVSPVMSATTKEHCKVKEQSSV
jgi:hypothetical protein